MSVKDDGGQAFPQPITVGPNADAYPAYPGMSLRDWFAGQSIPAATVDYTKGIADYEIGRMFGGRGGIRREEIIATLAYQYADAMLAARKAGSHG